MKRITKTALIASISSFLLGWSLFVIGASMPHHSEGLQKITDIIAFPLGVLIEALGGDSLISGNPITTIVLMSGYWIMIGALVGVIVGLITTRTTKSRRETPNQAL